MTHLGLVRKENQDHFLVATLHKTARVRATSLPNPEVLELPSQRIASFAMVADGVGGHAGGGTASRAALEAVASYVTHAMNCFYTANEADDGAFLAALKDAALESHQAVVAEAQSSGETQGAATTLTLGLFVWPRMYILQVGDSRFYRYKDGLLTQLTRDQTVAQDMVDSGLLPAEKAQRSPFAHVLSSSIGGRTQPVVTQGEMSFTEIYLLCTDGLTKHVTEAQIAERLRTMTGSDQACRTLIDDALKGGGTDNVTVVVLRAVRKEG
ncbi:MAG: serine/threonine-protein phosphatase [Gemmatimonadales bacterium]|nr:serine/threonine-protein phosphatase [Gemmatimonadales bacterium]